jgi:hypothetical protein
VGRIGRHRFRLSSLPLRETGEDVLRGNGFPVFPTISRVAVGLRDTGKYGQDGRIVGDRRG